MKLDPARDPRSTNQLGELLGDSAIGHEGRAGSGDHAAVKTWLRLLACTTQIETEIRRRLRLHFDMTPPRFDYLAQLHRFRDEQPLGLTGLARCSVGVHDLDGERMADWKTRDRHDAGAVALERGPVFLHGELARLRHPCREHRLFRAPERD